MARESSAPRTGEKLGQYQLPLAIPADAIRSPKPEEGETENKVHAVEYPHIALTTAATEEQTELPSAQVAPEQLRPDATAVVGRRIGVLSPTGGRCSPRRSGRALQTKQQPLRQPQQSAEVCSDSPPPNL